MTFVLHMSTAELHCEVPVQQVNLFSMYIAIGRGLVNKGLVCLEQELVQ
jgi:hypothetical protein